MLYKEELKYYIIGTKLYYLPPLYCDKIEITPTSGETTELPLNNIYSFINRPISGSLSGIFYNYHISKTLGYRFIFSNELTTLSNAFTVRYINEEGAYIDHTQTVKGNVIGYFNFINTDYVDNVLCQAYTSTGLSTFSIAPNNYKEYDLPYSVDNMYKLKVTYSVGNPETGQPIYLYSEYNIASDNKIQFYYNSSEDNRVDKTNYLRQAFECYGNLRDSSSIINPTLLIENKGVITANYCYIPNFGRYYYIDDIISVRTNMWELSLRVDALMSFKEKILELDCKINRQEFNYNNYLVDSERLIENGLIYKKQPINYKNTTYWEGGGEPRKFFSYVDSSKDDSVYRYVIQVTGKSSTTSIGEPKEMYSIAPYSSTSRFLVVNRKGMEFIVNTLFESDFTENPSLLFNTLNGTVISITEYPFNLNAFFYTPFTSIGAGNILKLGLVNITVPDELNYKIYETYNNTSNIIPNNIYNFDNYNTSFGFIHIIQSEEFYIDYTYNNFLDYNLSKYELYLPYYGFYELDVNSIKNKGVIVRYYIDISSTQTIIAIYVNKVLFYTLETNIGFNIPFSNSDKNEVNRNILFNSIKTGLSLTTSAISISNSLTKHSLSEPKKFTPKKHNISKKWKDWKTQKDILSTENISKTINNVGDNIVGSIPFYSTKNSGGNFNGYISSILDMDMYILITNPIPIDVPNYNHLVGRPSDYSGQLKNLQGYTEVGACHMEGFDTATPSEVTEIENQIKTGVIL